MPLQSRNKMAATALKVKKEVLIESVRKYPCLYDTSRRDYKDDSVRENAWKMVCSDVLNTVHEDKTLLNEGKQDYLFAIWPIFTLQ